MLYKIKQQILLAIKWSGRFFKTDMLYVLKNGSWVSLGQAISIISALVMSIAFANLLPMHEYGLYKYIISFIGVLGAIRLSGMSSITVQASSKGFDGTLRAAIKTSLHWSVIPLLLYLGSAGYYYYKNDIGLSLGIGISGALSLVTSAYGIYGSFLNGKGKFKLSAIQVIVMQIMTFISMITSVLFTNSVLLLVLANFATTAALVLFFSFQTLRSISPDSPIDHSLLKLGKHMSLMNILSGLSAHLDKIFVFQRLGSVELALYAFAIAIPEQFRSAYKNFLAIIVPKYSILEKSALRRSVIRKNTQLMLLTLGLILSYIVSAPYIFELLFPNYLDSVFYSQIYVFVLLTIPPIFLLNTYFQIQKCTKVLYKTNMLSDIVGLLLTVGLIYFLGLLGAALSNIAGRFIRVLFFWFYFIKDK